MYWNAQRRADPSRDEPPQSSVAYLSEQVLAALDSVSSFQMFTASESMGRIYH